MIKIDWILYFRHRVIFGVHLTRKFDAHGIRNGPWHFRWKWDWGAQSTKSRTMFPVYFPWHRCWRWDSRLRLAAMARKRPAVR